MKILDFTANPTVATVGDTITLKWSTTDATEVVITGVGSVPVNGTTTVKPTADTSYTLIAYGRRSQASAFVLVKIGPKVEINPNRPPVANAGPDQTFYRNTVTLDGTRSYDPDNDPITYSWRLVTFNIDPAAVSKPGPTTPTITGATTATPSVSLPQWGTYIFELTVRDPKGLSSTSITRLTFVDP